MDYHASKTIATWRDFSSVVRPKGCNLLKKLDMFPESILVTGCQRSGTTMLAKAIAQSKGMINYSFVNNDELAAALILSGYVEHVPRGRYCFQTTYLNECYHEYLDHSAGHRIIWVIRNPFSVVYSMLQNWNRRALNELFQSCGAHLIQSGRRRAGRLSAILGISRLRRACYGYSGKTSQVFELMDSVGPRRLLVVNYDEIVTDPETILRGIYRFVSLPYESTYGPAIHNKSIRKSSNLSKSETGVIDELCSPVYEKALTLTR